MLYDLSEVGRAPGLLLRFIRDGWLVQGAAFSSQAVRAFGRFDGGDWLSAKRRREWYGLPIGEPISVTAYHLYSSLNRNNIANNHWHPIGNLAVTGEAGAFVWFSEAMAGTGNAPSAMQWYVMPVFYLCDHLRLGAR